MRNVFLYKMEMAELAPNSVKTHLKQAALGLCLAQLHVCWFYHDSKFKAKNISYNI